MTTTVAGVAWAWLGAWLRAAIASSTRAIGLALAFVVLASAGHASAREVPPLRARVNDTAGMLSGAARDRLEQRLAAYERETGRQFAVLTIDTLEGDSLEDFSIRTVEAWKLGKKKVDDGLLLLVVRDDRKVRIEVGYGLEGVITDAFSSRVIREVITPAFRRGDYDGGVETALDVLMRAASDGKLPELGSEPPQRGRPRGGGSIFGLILFAIFFLLPLLGPLLFLGRGRRHGAAAIGGILGGMGSYHRRRGSWGTFGGGGFGGGGFGGGGFSGGGGGFGGGGASGSW